MNQRARSGFRLRLAALTAAASCGASAADLRIAPPPPPPRAREALKRTSRPGGQARLLRPLLQFSCLVLTGLLPMAAGAQTGAPTVSGVQITSIPRRGDTYGPTGGGGEIISIAVFFSESVTVVGTPQLALDIGGQARQADYVSGGSGFSSLRFTYSVQSSDVDTDGIGIAANALTLNGGSIQDSDSNNAVLDLGSYAISNASNHKVEGRIGIVWISPPRDGGDTYEVNENIDISIAFGEGVVGNPTMPRDSVNAQLALMISSNTRQATAAYIPLSPFFLPDLHFDYEVQSTDIDADGLSIAAGALTVTGGTLQDSNGNAAHLNLGTHAFANDANHKFNGALDNPPFAHHIGDAQRRPPIDSTWRLDERIEIFVGFGEPVSVTGVPQLALTIGGNDRQADYLRCNGGAAAVVGGFCTTGTLVFEYVVQPSDRDPNGISIAANALTLNSGTIRDRGGNNAQLDLSAGLCAFPFCFLNDNSNHKVDGGIEVPQPGGGTPSVPPPPSPPPNERPVAVGEFDDLDLDPDERAEVSLLGKFRDPEGSALAYSAESLNPEVANAVVSEGRLWVDGRSPGLATVMVMATDSGGLSAQQEFQVKVGRVLTFAEAVAAVPEGGVARLKVELSRPSERTVSVGYVLESDGDPSTADADDADHGGSDGTLTLASGETEAFIEVPILDDEDIEPAREHLRVRLLAPASESDWALGLAMAAVVIQEGVCDRTPEVRDALRGSRECWAPSVGDLAGTGYLNLSRQGIASLRERDFLGLAGLRVLHLHGNGLAELPGGLFAGLGALERLRLNDNRLAELPDGLFEGLGLLSSLDLGGNRLSSLPAGLLAGAPALTRLDLNGNRIRSLPDGFFEGASNLSELDLSGNPGAPFTLTMDLTRTDAANHAPGPATVVVRVAAGAPFALSAGLVAEDAELSADMAVVGAGDISGAPIQALLTEGGAARLLLSGVSEAPSDLCGEVDEGRRPCFQGLVVEAGPGLLLFKRAPQVVQAVPEQGVESLGGALSLNLAGSFAADGDDALTYSAESSDPALASVEVSGGVLSIEPNDEGLEGFVTVRLTATDSDGLEVEHSFTVEVSPPARSFGSGWRLGWLTGAPVPAAEAAPVSGEPK